MVTTERPHSQKHRIVVTLDNGTTLDWKTFQGGAEFGYAITVHRAQGAEAPIIVFLMPSNTTRCTQRLIYTALTRASKRFVLIGDPDRFNDIVETTRGFECTSESLLTPSFEGHQAS